MKKVLYFAAFLLGGATGALIGSLITKKKLEKDLDKQIKSIEEHLQSKKDDISDNENLSKEYKSDSEIVNDILGEKESSIKTTKPNKEYVDYTKYARSSTADTVPEIEIVSFEKFQESQNQDHVLEFYTGDNVVIDEDGNDIPNWKELIGNIDSSKYNFEEGGRMYIMNHKLNEDYQVIFCDRPYYETEKETTESE